jgi:hypothetical protein
MFGPTFFAAWAGIILAAISIPAVAVSGWTITRARSHSEGMGTAILEIPKATRRRIKAVPGNPFAGLEHLAGSVSLPTSGTSREKIRNRLKAKYHH